MCVPLWETFYYSTCVRPSVGDILLQHMCASLCGRHSTTAHVCVPLWETFYYSTCVRPSVGDILLQHMCASLCGRHSTTAHVFTHSVHKDFGPHELLYSIQFTSLYLLNSIDFLFSMLYTTPSLHVIIFFCVLHKSSADIMKSDIQWGSKPPHLQVQ